MKHTLLSIAALLLSAAGSFAQPDFVNYEYTFDYFLPKMIPDVRNGKEISLTEDYDASVPRPNQVLEFELGEQAVDYNDVLNYMYALDRASDRVSIRKYGKTYENRRFIHVIITSPANQARLEEIRQQHLQLSDIGSSDNLKIEDMPVIVNLVSTIHGREPSGVNASLAVAYLFAASKDKTILDILDNTVLILTPGMSPDGLNRYATWLNSSNSGNQTPDKNSREFLEPWPRSYHNHYWHDANRDMLMCQHPEGVNAVRMYLDWMPNVINDHHEQRGKDGVFYSPGDPRRTHPLIPKRNQEITAELGKYTEAILKSIGQPCYSGRTYDDFFLGKNSAYGDVQGSIGILIEQARSDSYIRHWRGGLLDLPMTIRNQSFVGVTTVFASWQMREELLAYQRDFFKRTAREAEQDPVKGYVFRSLGGDAVAYHFIRNMKDHEIDVYRLAKPYTEQGVTYSPEDSYVIPLNQKFYAKFRSIWEDMHEYEDVTFYDVTTWSFKRAFNLQNAPLKDMEGLLGEIVEPVFRAGTVNASEKTAGYVFEAKEHYSHNLLTALLQKGVKVSVARKPFTAGKKKYGCGTAVVSLEGQSVGSDEILSVLTDAARVNGVDVTAIKQVPKKAELHPVTLPNVGMIVGRGFSAYDNGELWFMLDRRFGLTPARIDYNRLHTIKNLGDYTVLTMINGTTQEPISQKSQGMIRTWVENGGTLIVTGTASKIVNTAKLGTLKMLPGPKVKGDVSRNFGIIVNATLDTSSPLGYGYEQTEIPVFKRNNIVVNPDVSVVDATPISYTKEPLLSGCISDENLARYSGGPAAVVIKCGKGRVIYFADNMNFRSYWFATMKIFMNAIYFGNIY